MSKPKSKRPRNPLIRDVRAAFSATYYPGDNHLVNHPEDFLSREMADEFLGKRWQDVSLKLAYDYRIDLNRFTSEAFRYYLPAYLIACISYSKEAMRYSDIEAYLFLTLSPKDEFPTKIEWLSSVIEGLDLAQIAVIRQFLIYFLYTNPLFDELFGAAPRKFWQLESADE